MVFNHAQRWRGRRSGRITKNTNFMADLKLVKQNVALFSVLLVMAIIAFVLNLQIAEANKAASEAERTRELSLQLVDELRQSSDDLTRMARLYVVTGDSTYIQYFNEVIAIREGKQLRPIDYHEIYWDFVLADGKKPRPGSEKTPMVELVKEYIESAEALEYFVKAKSSSDDLILIEEEAFNAVKGLFKDSLNTYSIQSVPDLDYASKLLHGEDYLKAKAKIMLSIQDFSHFVSQSTNSSINEIKSGLTRLSFLLIVVVLVAIVVLIVVVFTNLRHLLGSRKKQEKSLSTDKISLIGILHEMERSWAVVLLSFVFSVLVFAFLYYANTSIKENIEKILQ